ncbi:uncharacterized protein LOC114465374 isoform X2 [Gouania willdenowi]|uniref:Uncharacterized LOC114465374 n=1 Tax=Gouania willdenowi TaxID=441366 RepID=A0A8C5H070_GOUWI|nr:uncharacterized protein LOC114465374 isoform X2 [Gouania willdenowi]
MTFKAIFTALSRSQLPTSRSRGPGFLAALSPRSTAGLGSPHPRGVIHQSVLAGRSLPAASMSSSSVMRTDVTVHRLTKNVTLYVNKRVPPPPAMGEKVPFLEEHKPLMLMLPWLGASPKAMSKYCEIYFRTGFDVLVVESEVQEFLWPRWGLDNGKRLMDMLHSEPLVSRPLLVHAFSIGGYTFSNLLMLMSEDAQKYQELNKRIKGQVFDSLVLGSVDRMTTGLGKTLFPRLAKLVKFLSSVYFRLFPRQTLDYFNAAVNIFWNTPVKAPALFFSCDNDELSDAQTLDKLIAHWRGSGIDVVCQKWLTSTHAGHLRRYPQEYVSTLSRFIHSLPLAPLKAKL